MVHIWLILPCLPNLCCLVHPFRSSTLTGLRAHLPTPQNNVLISSTGDALLCDFGLAIVLSDLAFLSGNPSDLNGVGTGRYMAPELFALTGDHEGDGESEGDVAKTMASDVFAFGMLVAEVSFFRYCSQGC